MKTPPKWFCELLFWSGLLLLLIGAMPPVITCGVSMVLARECGVLKDLCVAIKSFEAEYGHFPLSANAISNEDLNLDTANSRLMGALLGQNLPDNKRGIRFIELPLAKWGKGGLKGKEGEYRLIDSFGNPYQIIMDTNRDSRVLNPDLKNSESKIRKDAPEYIHSDVIVFSGSGDGILHTFDDIPSWRPGGRVPPPLFPDLSPLIWIGLTLSIIGAFGFLLRRRSRTSEA
jgi:hypothetical protein